jgi:hypothetical protein
MKQNFTVRQGALDGVEAFLSVARHRSVRRAAAELGDPTRRSNGSIAPWSFVDGNKAVEAVVAEPLIAHDYPTLIGAAIQGVGLAQVTGPLAKTTR